jgi:5-methylcytosine-specific restriction endonuclease McrA
VICSICPRDVPTLLDGLYCSFRCRSIGRKPKKAKKPPTTGSRERKKRIRAMEKNYTAEDWQRALAYFDNKCAYCGIDGDLQQEHFVPVRDGGNYTPDNIIPACGPCNAEKQGRDPFKWLVVDKRKLREYIKIEDYFLQIAQMTTGSPETKETADA